MQSNSSVSKETLKLTEFTGFYVRMFQCALELTLKNTIVTYIHSVQCTMYCRILRILNCTFTYFRETILQNETKLSRYLRTIHAKFQLSRFQIYYCIKAMRVDFS